MLLYTSFFFFNDTATTEIYTLSLHDALPISAHNKFERARVFGRAEDFVQPRFEFFSRHVLNDIDHPSLDRKSTRLNSSHANISYAVFCLKKKNKLHTEILIKDHPSFVQHYHA